MDGPRRVIVVSNNNNNNNSYTGSDDSNSSNNSNNGTAITKLLVANHAVVLSTGSRAAIPSQIKGLVEAHPWTSRNATSAKKAPRSLAIIGDGAVACAHGGLLALKRSLFSAETEGYLINMNR